MSAIGNITRRLGIGILMIGGALALGACQVFPGQGGLTVDVTSSPTTTQMFPGATNFAIGSPNGTYQGEGATNVGTTLADNITMLISAPAANTDCTMQMLAQQGQGGAAVTININTGSAPSATV
jgi:hypothetical protein